MGVWELGEEDDYVDDEVGVRFGVSPLLPCVVVLMATRGLLRCERGGEV